MFERVIRDARYAARALGADAGFTIAAVITLAFGIGAVTALFTVLDGVLLKPLAYADPERTVALETRYPHYTSSRMTGGDLIDITREREGFDRVAYYNGGEVGVQVAGRAELTSQRPDVRCAPFCGGGVATAGQFVGVIFVHPQFFEVFGTNAVAGRTFAADDERRSAAVGLDFAQRTFGSAERALGQRVFVENRHYEIVGVMPEVMRFPGGTTEVWIANPPEPANRNRSGHTYRAVARLAPGVTLDHANARLTALASRLAAAFPENKDKTFAALPLRDSMVNASRTTLYVLMGAVVLVLLIACANVANLMLARSAARARAASIRAALGASRHHLVGEQLIESLLLAVMACGLGIALAYLGTRALLAGGTPSVPLPRLSDVQMDWRVLAFSIGLSILTIVGFGLVPALRAARADGRGAMLRAGAGSRGAAGQRSRRLRNGLVVAQIALACVVSINAGLLLRSFISMTEAPLGFDTEHVMVMYAHAPAEGSIFNQSGLDDYLRVGRLFDDVLTRVRKEPDVVAAGAAMGLPTGRYSSEGAYQVEGKHEAVTSWRQLPQAGFRLASPGYFATMKIPVLGGRDFTESDIYEQPAVAIVSESLAKQTFPGENPIGRRIKCGLDRDVWMTVVGVVGDVRQASPASRPGPELYMPLRQHPYTANEIQMVVRGRGKPEALSVTVQKIVRDANPAVAMKFLTLNDSVSRSIAAPRLRATLVSTFASLALLLAIAGVYAVISYTTAQRTAELGLRVAMGAQTRDILRLVLGGAAGLALAGITVGLLLAAITSRVVASFLFGVTHTDAMTYAGVFVVTLPLVLAAAALPAWRASRVDPLAALRSE